MFVGYVRVSTVEQNEARQLEAMHGRGVEKIYTEKESAKNFERPVFEEMMDFLREGDTLYIVDFSRLSRSLKDLLDVVEELDKKGVHLVSMKENIDTGTATGKLMLSMLGAINEFERTNMLERQREGIAIAKRRGVYKGRQKKTLPDISGIYRSWATREKSKSELAKENGVSRPTLDKLLREYERDVLAKRKGTV